MHKSKAGYATEYQLKAIENAEEAKRQEELAMDHAAEAAWQLNRTYERTIQYEEELAACRNGK